MKGLMVYKIDLEKAYNTIAWDFINYSLKSLNFSPSWCKLTATGLSYTAFSILIKGEMSKTFIASRGLRQEDSISPYPFIFAMEMVSGWIE